MGSQAPGGTGEPSLDCASGYAPGAVPACTLGSAGAARPPVARGDDAPGSRAGANALAGVVEPPPGGAHTKAGMARKAMKGDDGNQREQKSIFPMQLT